MTDQGAERRGAVPVSVTRKAGGLAALGLVVAGSLWASEPGAADPPASSWIPGQTVTTWDWERHWNYWMEWKCASLSTISSTGKQSCFSWIRIGPTWKPCGPEVRPPQTGRTNTCNIGQPGGHRPHGDNTNSRYTYLGRHEDRTGPTYPVCANDPNLPADTSPGNCGSWIEVTHLHCPSDASSHPPDCPKPDLPPTSGAPQTPDPTKTPNACALPPATRAFREAVSSQPDPGHGLQPPSFGYVRAPLKAFYPHPTAAEFRVRVLTETVRIRIWLSEVAWSFAALGVDDGPDQEVRVFRRTAPDRRRAASLGTPETVKFGDKEAIYLKSSRRSGRPGGYPVVVTVVWRGECLDGSGSGPISLGRRVRLFNHRYRVYEIRSRPGEIETR